MNDHLQIIKLPFLESKDGYAVYSPSGHKVVPKDPRCVWELSMRPATLQGVNYLLKYVLERSDEFEMVKVKENLSDPREGKLKDPRCSKIEVYFIKETPEESSEFVRRWCRDLHTDISDEQRKKWLPVMSCALAPQNMVTLHPHPEDHELSMEEGCMFAFSQGGEYSSRPQVKEEAHVSSSKSRDSRAYTTEVLLGEDYDGQNYYKYRGTFLLPSILKSMSRE